MKIKTVHLVMLAVPFLAEHARGEPPDPVVSTAPDWSAISKQLEEMLEADQATRKKVSQLMRQPDAIPGA